MIVRFRHSGYSMGKKKVLVIDDDQDILDAISFILDDAGYTVITRDSASDVEAIVQTNFPDLIILDVFLSGYDGREVTKNLRKRNETKNTPIILISAHPFAPASILKTGASAFIPKPFDIDVLLQKMKLCIE